MRATIKWQHDPALAGRRSLLTDEAAGPASILISARMTGSRFAGELGFRALLRIGLWDQESLRSAWRPAKVEGSV